MSTRALLALAMAAALAIPSCRGRKPQTNKSAGKAEIEAAKDVLAMVGTTPIGEADVAYRMKTETHATELTPQARKNLLQIIIRNELAAQRAIELGLDRDPAFQTRLGELRAQVAAFERDRLAELLLRHEANQVEVSEADAREYYDAHAAEIGVELHFWQILERDRKDIEADLAALEAGKRFEEVAVEVAKRRAPKLVETGGSFWDMGFLKWGQVPEPWRKVVAKLEPGQVSPIIEGGGNRFWILKLVERRPDPNGTFEQVKAPLIDRLEAVKIEERQGSLDGELRARTRVTYTDPSLAPGPAGK